ncbi:hypothetical protein DPEC_G00117260 [Dallia pectoralis]|uniref:Uncharacterized protein n=1 Tax=Dallia pectoralis TaxID=75939 RepID=A0ACC2GVD0_DALPE|nr:hypothetical protein DPEC_G00117260 [Dallia pectoralis]
MWSSRHLSSLHSIGLSGGHPEGLRHRVSHRNLGWGSDEACSCEENFWSALHHSFSVSYCRRSEILESPVCVCDALNQLSWCWFLFMGTWVTKKNESGGQCYT